MTPQELAYIAGFFDGEGTVGIKIARTAKSIIHSPYVTISQVRPEVLHWMRAHFGGSICFKKPHKKFGGQGIWVWQLSHNKGLRFLDAIKEYVRIKRAEVDLTVEAFQVKTRNKRAGVPANVVELRSRNMETLKAMR